MARDWPSVAPGSRSSKIIQQADGSVAIPEALRALHGSGENQTEGLASNRRKKKNAERKSQTLHLRAALLNAEILRLGFSDAVHLDGAVISYVAGDFYCRTQIFIRVHCILILDR